ncbi:hypothetical protein Apmu_0199_08 [Acidiphilium multivorum AIU301]|nr:hypothetical protein Apmu_0199_08 [Acidiphilium multivorum AIU301]
MTAMEAKIVPLPIPDGSPHDGLRFTPDGTGLDPRLVAMVRLLARQAADAYYDETTAPIEDHLSRR